ncbi:MAG TPA: DsbA family protein [Polyangia bacterium]|nr:DsbA family protein [Polyangia bacterium]
MPVALRLYSDFVCPFCFVAEQSTVLRLLEEFDLEIDWRGFPLHPRTPKGGMPLAALLGEARIPAAKEHMKRFAARFGVTGIVHPERVPNTRRVLAMAEHARAEGKLEAFRKAGIEAHWRAGNSLESDEDLRAIAESVGLDGDEALAAADSPRFQAEVDRKLAEAAEDGVTGIPTFFIGDEAVVGCQPYEVLAAAAERAGAKRRARPT